jgi:F0F1-type ATP synthase epsilon subunit
MQFSLATPEDSKKLLSNVTTVKIYLTTGVVEILEKHQDLLGKVSLDLIEVQSNQDNKSEKFKFLVQDALVIVSNKGLNSELTSETGVYIFAKRVLEFNSSISLDQYSKKVEQKLSKLEVEKQALMEDGANFDKIKTKIFILEDELKFEQKVLSILKDLRT